MGTTTLASPGSTIQAPNEGNWYLWVAALIAFQNASGGTATGQIVIGNPSLFTSGIFTMLNGTTVALPLIAVPIAQMSPRATLSSPAVDLRVTVALGACSALAGTYAHWYLTRSDATP